MIRIINGSCDDTNIVNRFKDNEFDLLFCSPPYNVGTNSNSFWGQKYLTIESDFNKDYANWLINIIKLWLPKCKMVMINIQELSNNKLDLIKLMYELKDYYIDRFYWMKTSAIPQVVNNCMTNCVEWVLCFSKVNNGRCVSVNKDIGYVRNIFEANQNFNNEYCEIHKALMAQPFCDRVIKTFCKENSKVIDIFGGLGTTAISCIKNNCDCVLIEKESKYCEVCFERLNKFNNQLSLTYQPQEIIKEVNNYGNE